MTRMGRPPGPQGPRKPSAPTTAKNRLAGSGYTLEQARKMSNAELLAIPGFGKGCLAYVRGDVGQSLTARVREWIRARV